MYVVHTEANRQTRDLAYSHGYEDRECRVLLHCSQARALPGQALGYCPHTDEMVTVTGDRGD